MFWIYFILCVVLNVYITIFFRLIRSYSLDRLTLVVLNYAICTFTGILTTGWRQFNPDIFEKDWFYYSTLLGASFLSLFWLIGYCAENIGTGYTSVANKLSMIIPAIFGILVYHESAGPLKWLGLLLALIGVIMVMYQKNSSSNYKVSPFFPLMILFLGSGYLDTFMKYMEKNFLSSEEQPLFVTCIFLQAFIFGLFWIVLRRKKITLDKKYYLSGIALGIPNYFSILALMAMLKSSPYDSSTVFPLNNLSIVIITVMIGHLIFHEKLNRSQLLGLGLAICSIFVLLFI